MVQPVLDPLTAEQKMALLGLTTPDLDEVQRFGYVFRKENEIKKVLYSMSPNKLDFLSIYDFFLCFLKDSLYVLLAAHSRLVQEVQHLLRKTYRKP